MDLTAIREAETFKWTASEQPGWGTKPEKACGSGEIHGSGEEWVSNLVQSENKIKREFDPGSESTLAARLTHASRTRKVFGLSKVAHG